MLSDLSHHSIEAKAIYRIKIGWQLPEVTEAVSEGFYIMKFLDAIEIAETPGNENDLNLDIACRGSLSRITTTVSLSRDGVHKMSFEKIV